MQKVLLIIGPLLLTALVACGREGSSGTESVSAASNAAPFRISTGTSPIRYARDIERNANGLSGREPKPILPDSPPPDFLVLHDLIEGIGGGRYGGVAVPGDEVEVQYVGYVYETEKKFASSWEEGKPFVFTLGSGEMSEGWEEGLDQIEAGDRREMVIPPDLTMGGSRVEVPATTVVFVVDALRVM